MYRIPAFPAPTAAQIALFATDRIAAVRNYRTCAHVALHDGSTARPTLRATVDILRAGIPLTVALSQTFDANGVMVGTNFEIVDSH